MYSLNEIPMAPYCERGLSRIGVGSALFGNKQASAHHVRKRLLVLGDFVFSFELFSGSASKTILFL